MSTTAGRLAPVGDCRGWLAHNTRNCPCYVTERAQAGTQEPLMASTIKIPMSQVMKQVTLHMVITGTGRARLRIWLGTQVMRAAAAIMGCGIELTDKPNDDEDRGLVPPPRPAGAPYPSKPTR